MEPVETIYATPSVRVHVYYDNDPINPLEEWDHGVQFETLPDPSRTWKDYKEPASNTYEEVRPITFDYWTEYREFNEWEPGYSYSSSRPPAQSPSLITFLNDSCSAWLPITRDGYNGTIVREYDDDPTRWDAIALITRDMYRAWHMIPDGKPMPRGYRENALKSLQSVIDEYNSYATGDVYGYQVQTHNPLCLDCMDPDDADPDPDCDEWHDTDDSCWGFIGYKYAIEEATHAAMNEAGTPISQAA